MHLRDYSRSTKEEALCCFSLLTDQDKCGMILFNVVRGPEGCSKITNRRPHDFFNHTGCAGNNTASSSLPCVTAPTAPAGVIAEAKFGCPVPLARWLSDIVIKGLYMGLYDTIHFSKTITCKTCESIVDSIQVKDFDQTLNDYFGQKISEG